MDKRLTYMTTEEIQTGFVNYFKKIAKPIKENYEPMSFDMWKMYRDLEPNKFGLDYETYVRLKSEQYSTDLERKKNTVLELINFKYSLNEFDLYHAQNKIKKIEKDPLFVKWVNTKLIENILKM